MELNYKLLSMWICFILILWIILLHITGEEKIQHIREHFANEEIPYDYQMEQLSTNYDSIDKLDQTISTKERQLQLLNQKADTLNRTAYVLKYVTIVSISILILMICIFVLNFDDIRGPSALAKQNIRGLFGK